MTERSLTAKAVIHGSVRWFSLVLVIPVFAAFQLDRGLSLTQLGLNVAVLSGVVAAGVLILAFSLPAILLGFIFMGLARALYHFVRRGRLEGLA